MKKGWAQKTKYKNQAYEISELGDKKLMDLNCRLSNGKTIYESIQTNNIEDYYSLWVRYFNENPNEYQTVLNKTLGYDLFTCKDAENDINPANAISWILNEYYGYNNVVDNESTMCKFFEW
jgi:hypothetical protein